MPITGTAYIPNVAPGIYSAVVTNVEEKAAKDDPTNVFRVWEFSLQDGRTVSGSSSLSTTPKSKGGKWIAAIIGHPLAVGETVELVGMRCTVIVAIKDTTGYEFVETVAPATVDNKPQSHPPVIETVTAAEAERQHALQEGDGHDGPPVLP